MFTEYTPLAGDRNFADDHAVMGGIARIDGRPVMVIGHEKGNDTKSRIERNFGMARPEGYRKAIRLMDLAAKFRAAGDHADRHARRVSRQRRARSAGSPKRLPARPRNAWQVGCRWSA